MVCLYTLRRFSRATRVHLGKVLIIDTTLPGYINTERNKRKKWEKYQVIVREISRRWSHCGRCRSDTEVTWKKKDFQIGLELYKSLHFLPRTPFWERPLKAKALGQDQTKGKYCCFPCNEQLDPERSKKTIPNVQCPPWRVCWVRGGGGSMNYGHLYPRTRLQNNRSKSFLQGP